MKKRTLRAAGPALAAAGVLGGALLGGCSPTVSNLGYRPDDAAVAQIQPGVTSRAQVQKLLGSPSSTATFDNEHWYYVSQVMETRSFYQSQLKAQDVTQVDFDANGVVTDVRRHGLDTAENVTPATQTTRTAGNELTVLQQFVGNIGRFNSDDPGATSRAASAAKRGAGSSGYGGF